jgi:transmembrane sensor
LTPQDAKDLLRKYREGTCTERELQIVNQWYENLDDEKSGEEIIDFNSLKKELFANINTTINREEGTERTLFWSYAWKVAAVIVLVAGLVFAFYNSKSTSEIVATKIAVAEKEKSSVNEGKIILADGTTVWVKRGSKLEFPKQFEGNTREVTLTGEAFFEVHKDPSKPFIIHSGNMVTRVLGTSFNVKAYENDKAAEVAVVTGKVSVSLVETNGKNSEVILRPNEKVTYFRELNKLVLYEERNVLRIKMNAQSELNFNDASLNQIAERLSTAFNVSIRFENEDLRNCVITADLSDQSLETSLKIITRSIGAKYSILHDEVSISGKGCQ